MADALSRKSSHDSICAAVSSCTPQWVSSVLEGYQTDEVALAMLAKLAIDPLSVPNFTLSEGVLRYKNKIWIGSNEALQQQLLGACHSSAIGGHSGVPVTYMRMKKIICLEGYEKSSASICENMCDLSEG